MQWANVCNLLLCLYVEHIERFIETLFIQNYVFMLWLLSKTKNQPISYYKKGVSSYMICENFLIVGIKIAKEVAKKSLIYNDLFCYFLYLYQILFQFKTINNGFKGRK